MLTSFRPPPLPPLPHPPPSTPPTSSPTGIPASFVASCPTVEASPVVLLSRGAGGGDFHESCATPAIFLPTTRVAPLYPLCTLFPSPSSRPASPARSPSSAASSSAAATATASASVSASRRALYWAPAFFGASGDAPAVESSSSSVDSASAPSPLAGGAIAGIVVGAVAAVAAVAAVTALLIVRARNMRLVPAPGN